MGSQYYSNDSTVNSIVEELVDRGFFFENGKGHGKLWTPGEKAFVVVVPKTPGDNRASLNFRSDVRRFLRANGWDPLAEDKRMLEIKERRANSINRPFAALAEAPAPTLEAEPVPAAPPEPKPLTGKDFLLVDELRVHQGLSWGEVTEKLNGMGFTTRDGNPVNVVQVTQWFNARRRILAPEPVVAEEQAPAVEVKAAPAPVPALPVQKTPFLIEVTELISSNLSDEMKEKFLVSIAREHLSKGGGQ